MNQKLAKRLKTTGEFTCLEEEVLIHLQLAGWWVDSRKENFLKPFGLTRNQYNILRIVRGAGKAGIPLLDIGGRMVTKMPDVSRLVARLVKMKMVTCHAPEYDGRVKLVVLASEGQALLTKIDKTIKSFHQKEMSRLTGKELNTLNSLLAKVWE